ncbi:lipid A deacylase LpxR family protein [Parvularcula oceani]|uniref:lipid A deacylase LpxR family protein n=1 Tax=Parvularcula oceani TaxID=1247963 RepID=UPI00069032F5|nr:lipid A deacylase LpxR family protein [Parvularcula oceani]
MLRSAIAYASAAITCVVPVAALSQEAAERPGGVWSGLIENDWFASTDQNYTNGARLARFAEADPGGTHYDFAGGILRARPERDEVIYGFALGQNLYTPEDTDTALPLPGQRPYAAWLYGEYSLIRIGEERVDQLTFQLGTVGPNALGEEVQNGFHDLIGGEDAEGWDNQIGNEVGFVLSLDRKLKSRYLVREIRGLDIDFTPNAGIAFGNIRTDAKLGATLRIGTGLSDDFGPPRIRPASAGVGYFSPDEPNGFYAFFGAQGRAVAHDITLEGSLFDDDDGITVEPETFVGETQAGFVWRLNGWQLGYTHVWRGEEYEGQTDGQRFGALSVAVRF